MPQRRPSAAPRRSRRKPQPVTITRAVPRLVICATCGDRLELHGKANAQMALTNHHNEKHPVPMQGV